MKSHLKKAGHILSIIRLTAELRVRIAGVLALVAMLFIFAGCAASGWTAEEISIINVPSDTLHVYTIETASEREVLRRESCLDFSDEMLSTEEYARLAVKMLATVTAPSQDGVGIAGPQVGISRNIVCVQRFDKPGEPFETYPNIRIINYFGEQELGPEGCLSVPGKSGEVVRYRDIEISYRNPVTMRDTTERIEGFTAVIFQHECDHLHGVLYSDKLM